MKYQGQVGKILLITLFFLAGFLLIVMMSIVISDNQLQRAHHTHKESKRYLYSVARLQQLKTDLITKKTEFPITKMGCGDFDYRVAEADLTAWYEDPFSQGNSGIFIQSECQSTPVFVIGQQPALLNQVQTVYLGNKVIVQADMHQVTWLNFNLAYSDKMPESLEDERTADLDASIIEAIGIEQPQDTVSKMLLNLEGGDQISISLDHILSRIRHTISEDQYHWSVDLKSIFTLDDVSTVEHYIVNQLIHNNKLFFVIIFSKPLINCKHSCEQLNLALLDDHGAVLQHFTMPSTENFSGLHAFAISQSQLVLINTIGEVYVGQLSQSKPIRLELQQLFSFNLQEKTQINPLWFETNLQSIPEQKDQILEKYIANIRLNFRTSNPVATHFFSLVFDLDNHLIPLQSVSDLSEIIASGEIFSQNILIRLRQSITLLKSNWYLAFNLNDSLLSEQLHQVFYVNDLIILHTVAQNNTDPSLIRNWVYVLKKTGENWFSLPNILAFSIQEQRVVIQHEMNPSLETIYLHPKCQVPNFSIMVNQQYMIGCSAHQLMRLFR